MVLQNLFRWIRNRLTDRNIPFPDEPQPLEYWRALELSDETIASFETQWNRERHGPLPVFRVKLTGVDRIMEYYGQDINRVSIGPDQHWRGEATIITPEGDVYNVPISLRNGETWSQERQNRQLASALKEKNPNLKEASDVVVNSTVKINWYRTTYETPLPSE